jgi:hypothetical protein
MKIASESGGVAGGVIDMAELCSGRRFSSKPF